MFNKVLGVRVIERLYVELLFKCNFKCPNCYHGKRLEYDDRFSPKEVVSLARNLQMRYGLRGVTLLGGEPFLYPKLTDMLGVLKGLDLHLVIITNGYRIASRLSAILPFVDELRVSVDGLEINHDRLRRPGSFREAIRTLAVAKQKGLPTSVTMSVDKTNVGDVLPLARVLAEYGIRKLDVHLVRSVDANQQNQSAANSLALFEDLDEQIRSQASGLPVPILFEDEILHPSCLETKKRRLKEERVLDRINLQANGEAYLSCSYTGTGLHSFRYDKVCRRWRFLNDKNREINLLGISLETNQKGGEMCQGAIC